jgi:ferredoxin--NADP+ reductase
MSRTRLPPREMTPALREAPSGRATHTIQAIRNLSPSTYVLRFDRQNLVFQPGQYLMVGPAQGLNMREYSIYSPTTVDYLEILVKEVDNGLVSKQMRKLIPGSPVQVEGPFGYFLLPEEAQMGRQAVQMIATGTGISPMRCFIESYPAMDYALLHGTRGLMDHNEYDFLAPDRFTCCVSRETKGPRAKPFGGRVTEYLQTHKIDSHALYYLCGNCDMIYAVYDHLKGQGIPAASIKAEVYF